jgi:hypothetical protein
MDPCPFPEIVESPQGTWEHSLVVSCDSPEATQFDWKGASVIRTLTLVDDRQYDLTVRGGEGVTVMGCHTQILAEPLPSSLTATSTPKPSLKHLGSATSSNQDPPTPCT